MRGHILKSGLPSDNRRPYINSCTTERYPCTVVWSRTRSPHSYYCHHCCSRQSHVLPRTIATATDDAIYYHQRHIHTAPCSHYCFYRRPHDMTCIGPIIVATTTDDAIYHHRRHVLLPQLLLLLPPMPCKAPSAATTDDAIHYIYCHRRRHKLPPLLLLLPPTSPYTATTTVTTTDDAIS